jgi:hypothetical protein
MHQYPGKEKLGVLTGMGGRISQLHPPRPKKPTLTFHSHITAGKLPPNASEIEV